MSENKELLNILLSIQSDIVLIKQGISLIQRGKAPNPSGFNPVGKRLCYSHKLRGGLLDKDVREMILKLRADGHTFNYIAAFIRNQWPEEPTKHPSRSAIHRFIQSARNGRLKEYGIES